MWDEITYALYILQIQRYSRWVSSHTFPGFPNYSSLSGMNLIYANKSTKIIAENAFQYRFIKKANRLMGRTCQTTVKRVRMYVYKNGHNDVITFKRFPHNWPLCERNPLVTGGFPSQRPVTRTFEVSFDVSLNKLLDKQLSSWWLETPRRSFVVTMYRWCCNLIHDHDFSR